MVPRTTVVVALPDDPSLVLRLLESLAALPPHPDHEVILVDGSAGALDDILRLVEGDVLVLRAPGVRAGADALGHALPHVDSDVLVVLDEGVQPEGDWLAPLVSALGRAEVAAATSTGVDGVCALAGRRRDLVTAAGATLPELALALADRGAVRRVPESRVAPLDTRERGPQASPGTVPELSIVIPTLDAGAPRVRRALRALEAGTDVPHEVVLMHNGAPAQGFTPPVNAGLRAARAPYLVVMNDDVEPLPGWWAPLRGALDGGASVAFPRTIAGFDRNDFAAWCFAMTRETMEAHSVAPGDFFDPELVVHYQDTDLFLRLQAAGTPPVRVEEAAVRHGLSESIGTQDPVLRAWIADQVARDGAALARKDPAGYATLRVITPR